MKTKLYILTLVSFLLVGCGLTVESYFFTVKCNYGPIVIRTSCLGTDYDYLGLNTLRVKMIVGKVVYKGGNCEVIEVDGVRRSRFEEGDHFNPNFEPDPNYIVTEAPKSGSLIEVNFNVETEEDRRMLEELLKEILDEVDL